MPPIPVPIDQPAVHVDVRPGGELILRGSYYSTHDGTVIDAAVTTWPKDAPGGESVDPKGMFDLGLGGFHLESVDRATHEVHLRATGEPAPACGLGGVAAPCLIPRTAVAAHARVLS